MDLFTFAQAAQLLGKSRQTLESYQRRGLLKYDVKIGGIRYFKRQTLETFTGTLSIDAIAKKYNLTWEQVYQAMRQKHKVEPNDRLGRALFTRESVEMVAKAEGWIENVPDAERITRRGS